MPWVKSTVLSLPLPQALYPTDPPRAEWSSTGLIHQCRALSDLLQCGQPVPAFRHDDRVWWSRTHLWMTSGALMAQAPKTQAPSCKPRPASLYALLQYLINKLVHMKQGQLLHPREGVKT
jgi:hypothetical protein